VKNPEIDRHLALFPALGRLSREGEESVRTQAESLRIPAGTILLSEGQLCQALLLVAEGAIRVFKAAPSGREITLYTVKPGESCLLGVTCLLTDSHYPAQAVTGVETEALSVPAPVFRTLFASETSVQQYVVGLFSRRLSDVMTLVEEVAFRRMDERLASFLISSSDRGSGIYGPVTMSHEEIADHLGTAREVVSRLLSQFESEGMIAVERRVVRITDPRKLARRAAGDPR
jgi:CRP/FNR family transcriptional regulator